jgi:hypothetical protein
MRVEGNTIKMVKPSDIQTASPFKDLFKVNSEILDAIVNHMGEHGYDYAHPIIVWKEMGVVLQGHTRLQAVNWLLANSRCRRVSNGEFKAISVIEVSFDTEEEAVEYAVHDQVKRRNLSDIEILGLVEKLDELSDKWGGARSTESSSLDTPKLDSRQRTAEMIGISKDKVSYCRAILDEQDGDTYNKIVRALERGDKTLYKVYSELTEGKRREKRKQTKWDARETVLQKIDSRPFKTGTTRRDLSAFGKRVEHLDALCLDRLRELLKQQPEMEEIKEHVAFFEKEGGEMFQALADQQYIREFLSGPFVDDFTSMLASFGFEIKKPEGLPPTVRPEKPEKKKRRKTGFDITKANEPGFVSHAEEKDMADRIESLYQRRQKEEESH